MVEGNCLEESKATTTGVAFLLGIPGDEAFDVKEIKPRGDVEVLSSVMYQE